MKTRPWVNRVRRKLQFSLLTLIVITFSFGGLSVLNLHPDAPRYTPDELWAIELFLDEVNYYGWPVAMCCAYQDNNGIRSFEGLHKVQRLTKWIPKFVAVNITCNLTLLLFLFVGSRLLTRRAPNVGTQGPVCSAQETVTTEKVPEARSIRNK